MMNIDTMGSLRRTHYCGDLTRADIGRRTVVAGFVQKVRNLGTLIFIDLRDRTGIVQLAFSDATGREIFEKAGSIRSEYVLMAAGVVQRRESVNPDLPTGELEILVDDLRILSRAQTPPFEITDQTNVNEELRLRYRYLDLRRSEMQRTLIMRHRIAKLTRDYFNSNGFLEIETPMLIRSTPEGARDYLVPSRIHPGSFYALPQSPQQYKQLLMLAGYDRYMQIVRCFRDEALRADRQPEFTQIDLEMSFVDESDVMTVNEGFMCELFRTLLGVEVSAPFRRLTYKEAMERFGSDKPDTRFGLELRDLTPLLSSTECKLFASAVTGGGSVRAINVKGAAGVFTRKEIDRLTDLVKTYQAKGLAYTRMTGDGITSSYEKFLSDRERSAVRNALNAETDDLLLLVADADSQIVLTALGALRNELGRRLGLIPEGRYDLLWVTDFPLMEYDEEEKRYKAMHHPFTAPKAECVDMLEQSPGEALARAYDLVLNGTEVGGGSIRINDPAIQSRMFRALGFTEEQARAQFGFLIDAFSYGAPPHGGMAYGFDRLVMVLLGRDSIRDVIAFPKVQSATELMTMCPAPVEESSLRELFIRVELPQTE